MLRYCCKLYYKNIPSNFYYVTPSLSLVDHIDQEMAIVSQSYKPTISLLLAAESHVAEFTCLSIGQLLRLSLISVSSSLAGTR